jgi:imidazolonepropionase-like amidohydrolase
VPTLYTSEAILSPSGTHIPASEVERERQIREIQYQGFRRALAASLPIGFATDSGVVPHGQNAREFAVRVPHGC